MTQAFLELTVFRVRHHANLENSPSPKNGDLLNRHDLIFEEKERPSGAHASLVYTRKDLLS